MELQSLIPLGIAFVVVTIILALGSDIVNDMRQDYTGPGCNTTSSVSCGYAHNATVDGLTGISKISGKLDTIGLVVAIAVIVGVILTYMVYNRD